MTVVREDVVPCQPKSFSSTQTREEVKYKTREYCEKKGPILFTRSVGAATQERPTVNNNLLGTVAALLLCDIRKDALVKRVEGDIRVFGAERA